MVITDRFVYLHIPKSGGTFVEEALRLLFAEEPGLYFDTSTPPYRGRFGCAGQHECFFQVPIEHQNKKLLVTIRNPYDRHVSLFEFGWWKNHPHDTFDPLRIKAAFPHFPELSFGEYLTAVNDWELIDPSYAPAGGHAAFADLGVGPMTFDMIRFLAPDPESVFAGLPEFLSEKKYRHELPAATFVPTHRLNTGLHAFLLEMGFERSRIDFILSLGRILPDGSTRTEDMAWPDYYTPETRQLVRDRERMLFEMFPEFDE
jgi:hypothetical protein